MIIKKKFLLRMTTVVLIAFLFCGSVAVTNGRAQTAENEVVVENGTVILPIIHGNEAAVTALLPYLQQMPEFAGMAMTMLQPKGAAAMVILSGANEENLRTAAEKVQSLLGEAGRPHLLIISAYLRELDMSDNESIGIDWSALTENFTYGINAWNRAVTGSSYQYFPNLGQWIKTAQGSVVDTLAGGINIPTTAGYIGFNAELSRSLSKSRVIMGSNLYTPNGITGELVSQTIVPLQTTDGNGNATLTSQTISSDVKLTPTIVKYNEEKPEESVVRLDIYMQMALITDTVQVGASSAKGFSTKTLTTMGFVKADNNMYVAGVFAGDTETHSRTGIPVLMNIPFLKYLFSQESKEMTHKVGVLTVSVRILPDSVIFGE